MSVKQYSPKPQISLSRLFIQESLTDSILFNAMPLFMPTWHIQNQMMLLKTKQAFLFGNTYF